jgi:ribosomal protein L31
MLLSIIHTTKSLLPALPRIPAGLTTSSSTSSSSSRIRPLLRGCTLRSVSSSPYGRTHVWKRRPKRLPNPIVPQFPQRVIRSDGSSFTHWTTSPRALIRLTRDVANHPLWNVAALLGDGAAEESEVAGRLGRFNRKFVVEEVDWMSEAEGVSPVAATDTATTTTAQPPSKKKGDAS